jgi:diacylglycerol kinase family enzyme
VVQQLPFPLKRVFGRGAYVLQTLRELPRYRFIPIRLRIDDAEAEAGSVIISKGRLYAGRYILAPGARPGEPGFSVALFEHSGPWAALMYGAALPLDQLWRAPGVRHLRASRVDFIGNQNSPVQTDGDQAGYTPLSVVNAPGPIEIVVG